VNTAIVPPVKSSVQNFAAVACDYFK